jgi:hypothetical protein
VSRVYYAWAFGQFGRGLKFLSVHPIQVDFIGELAPLLSVLGTKSISATKQRVRPIWMCFPIWMRAAALSVGQYLENWDLASSPLPVGTPLDHIFREFVCSCIILDHGLFSILTATLRVIKSTPGLLSVWPWYTRLRTCKQLTLGAWYDTECRNLQALRQQIKEVHVIQGSQQHVLTKKCVHQLLCANNTLNVTYLVIYHYLTDKPF